MPRREKGIKPKCLPFTIGVCIYGSNGWRGRRGEEFAVRGERPGRSRGSGRACEGGKKGGGGGGENVRKERGVEGRGGCEGRSMQGPGA